MQATVSPSQTPLEVGVLALIPLVLNIATLLANIYMLYLLQRQLKSQTHAYILGRTYEISRLLLEHPEASERIFGVHQPEVLVIHAVLTHFEKIYYQHRRYGLLVGKEWEAWLRSMEAFLRTPRVRILWEEAKHQYPEDFKRFIDQEILKAV